MDKICEGRVAVVTGAGRGIGREHALALARCGAKVIVNDLGVARDGTGSDSAPADEVISIIQAEGGTATRSTADISTWAGAASLVQQAIDTYGRLDVVVNNAGILRDRTIASMSEEEWDAVIGVHLKGTFSLMRHAAAHWRDRFKVEEKPVHGRIINTTSVAGLYGNFGQANYCAAKAAIAALTTVGARELGRYGVTVNAIGPIAITRMTDGRRERTAEELAARDPAWVSPVVAWLASESSAKVNGRVIEAGGGILAIAEGWHRGPTAEPVREPEKVGAIIERLIGESRPNVALNGKDLASPWEP
ncbi:SDR family NAD(P)-dependent oxidoreductase [Hydrogenophaga sp.]|uniref:SDR family NAD(P)-dependent oxidoreductase n=1 Tax=Hydrogenophaga sp. TaxID=1904254 RepID=UPI00271A94E3|nr:SDR family NAD(P)-dependent oxidoreductase [Hydrogenophaga sp.]MDO9435959.1 SDR family NAD(P)-dependent oxidoreductase [Hydrogenophaga sp.]